MTRRRAAGAGGWSQLTNRILLSSGTLQPGEWTTYGEMALAATGGRMARLVGQLAANHPGFANAHRVLGAGGIVIRGRGGDESAARSRLRLEAEGVRFIGRRADPAARVGWIELRGRLAELDGERRARGSRGQRPTA